MKKTLLLNYFKAVTSRNPRKNMTRFNVLLTLFVMVMGMGVSWGQLLQWNTFGNTGTETSEPSTSNDSNILAATLNYTGSTVVPAANSNRFGGSNWGTTSISTDKYIQFTVTPNSGFSFTPTSFVFIWDRSGTGPQNVTLRSSIDNYTADIGTLTGLAASTSTFRTISISGITNITTATTFRFYGYNATGGTGGFDCASSQNNVVLNGTTASVSPEINIKESTTSYTSGSTFTFGNQVSGTSSSATTFTIENTGNATLNLSGTPIVAISGNTSEFTVDQTSTASTVAASGTTSFTVTFNPTSTGAKTAAISIANDDATGSENPYVINLTGTGTVNSSSASDIITQSGYSYTSNIDYASKQTASTLTIANSVGVNGLTLRDGGVTSDSDALGTTLTDITFSTGGSTAIRTAALFDGINKIAEVAVNGATSIVFTGLSLSATDGGTKDFELRVTYQSTVTDNQQITFTVSSATASASTSNFATANAGAAASSVTGDDNRLEVTASALAFVAQPVNTLVSAGMTNVTVSANDALANRDLDFTSSIRITSSGSLTGTPVDVSASSGLATFTSLTHTASGSSLTLNAERTSALDWDVTSSAFDITVQAPGLLITEDDFNYAASSNIITVGTDWGITSGNATKVNTTATNNGLIMTNYPSINSIGISIIAGAGEDVAKSFTAQTTGSIYASTLINLSSTGIGGYLFGFTTINTATTYEVRLHVRTVSGNLNFGISRGSGSVTWDPINYLFSTTYFVALKLTMNALSNDDRIDLFISSSISNTEPSSPNATITGATDVSTIAAVFVRQDTTAGAGRIDGIRVATNWGTLVGNPQYSDNTSIAAGNYNSITTYAGSTPNVTGNVNVYGQLSILGGTLTTNNTLTLKSDANGTARVSEVGSGGAITGNVTVERYIPAKRGWRLLTAPLKGSSSNTIGANWQGTANEGLLLFSPATYQTQTMTGYTTGGGSPNIWKYDSANTQWQSIPAISTENLFSSTVNNGFLVFATGPHGSNTIASSTTAEATTLKPVGQLITGSVDHSLTANKYHLLGNPYASPLDTAGLVTSNSGTTIWMVDPTLNTFGGYFAYDGTNWTPTTPSASDAYIQSGQGFFVKNAANTTFTIAESHKVSGNSNTWFERTTTDTSVDKIRVLLYKQINSAWQLADGILAANSASGNHEVDATDVGKMTNFNENLLFKNNTSNLAIEYRGLPAAGTLQPMQLTGTSAQPYELRIKTENYSNGNLTPYLENTQTGVLTAIPTDGSEVIVPFTGIVATSAAPDNRFRIVYQAPLSADDLNNLVVGVYPNPVHESLFTIELTNTNAPARYSLTNLLGQVVQEGSLLSLTNAIPVHDLSEGMYLLQINQEGKRFTTKLMIK